MGPRLVSMNHGGFLPRRVAWPRRQPASEGEVIACKRRSRPPKAHAPDVARFLPDGAQFGVYRPRPIAAGKNRVAQATTGKRGGQIIADAGYCFRRWTPDWLARVCCRWSSGVGYFRARTGLRFLITLCTRVGRLAPGGSPFGVHESQRFLATACRLAKAPAGMSRLLPDGCTFGVHREC